MPHTHAANKRSSIRSSIAHARDRLAAHRSHAATALLAAGWAMLTADAIPPIPLTIPDPLSDLIGWAVTTGTVILAVAWIVQGPLMYSAMKLGRQITAEALSVGRPRTPLQRLEDESTVGVGVAN